MRLASHERAKPAPGLIDAPAVRGWDFGGRNPACVWGQWSKRSRRFWVLREILGNDIDTYAFRDVVKFLSGQMALESLVAHNTPSGSNRAYELLEELSQKGAYPTPPWFVGATNAFVDFAGHEAVRPGPGLSKAGDPKVAAEVLAAGDIYVLSQYTFQRSRTQVINGLARLRNDGMPGIMLDPACPILINGLHGGGYVRSYGFACPRHADIAADRDRYPKHDYAGRRAQHSLAL